MSEVKPEEVQWNLNLYHTLNDGGTWSVPRSGLIFQKQAPAMVLILRMPWCDEMGEAARQGADVPPTKEALEAYQQNDFETIAARFRAGGIEVIDRSRMTL